MKREALYGNYKIKDTDSKLQEYVGTSNEFIKSLKPNCIPNIVTDGNALPIKETLLLASSNYEIGTKSGKEVGFMYVLYVKVLHMKEVSLVFIMTGVKAFLHTQGHMILFILMVYLVCTRTNATWKTSWIII